MRGVENCCPELAPIAVATYRVVCSHSRRKNTTAWVGMPNRGRSRTGGPARKTFESKRCWWLRKPTGWNLPGRFPREHREKETPISGYLVHLSRYVLIIGMQGPRRLGTRSGLRVGHGRNGGEWTF